MTITAKKALITAWTTFLVGFVIAYFNSQTTDGRNILLATYCLMAAISGWGSIQSFRLKTDLLQKVLNLGTFLFSTLITYLMLTGFLSAI